MKKEITKSELAKKLKISHVAIVIWEKEGKIPAERCMELEPILDVPARELFLHPDILFSRFKKKAA